jgi:MFS family permease
VSALIALTFTTVMLAANSFLPLYLVHVQGGSVGLAATFLVIRNVAMTIASPFFGYAVARTSLIATIVGANGLAVVALAAIAPISSPEGLAIVLALQGIGLGFAAATVNLLVMSATGTGDRALGLASNNLVARLGSLLSPIVFGVAFQTLGPRAVFVVAGLLGMTYVGAIVARSRLVGDQERRLWMPQESIRSD